MLDFDLLDYEEDDEFLEEENQLIQNTTRNDGTESRTNCIELEKQRSYSKSFRDLLLKQELLRAINDCGFESPSAVQSECIPQAIMGVDILCQAKSGMGKTCVFVLSTLQQLDTSLNKVMVLVLCHTRELAFQISKEYERFSKYMELSVAVFFGGIPQRIDEQVLSVNKPQVVVTTTGRLLGLIRSKKIDLRFVKHFILDECDKLLGQTDSLNDIVKIYRMLPRDKQVMMFSATMNDIMRNMAKKFMESPLEVIIGDDTQLVLHGLQQFYLQISEKDKLRHVFKLLTTIEFKQAMVFVNTINRCNALFDLFLKLNLSAVKIHSGMTQNQRLTAYETFKAFQKRILVATKMFDRGIDFERVNLVINYDMPDNSDTYLHAVGRAGRFGTKGVAISFISNQEAEIVRKQVQIRFNITLEELPEKVII